jgi:hypothetical protein
MPRFLWTQKQDTGPQPRLAHGMAFDSNRGRVILFGGDSLRSQLLNDTWAWDGEFWTQVADLGPSPRAGHAMAYDSARQRLVLFGGKLTAQDARDTWEWDGEDWTQVADDGPAARSGHVMAFDSKRNKTVLFGGGPREAGLLRDTWEWDGEAWTQVQDTGPSARRASACAFDNVRDRVVLFGGDSGGVGLGDTWEWDGAVWTQVADFGPEPRTGAAMVFEHDRAALFGGLASSAAAVAPAVFGNTWEWSGTHWTQRQDIGPGARWGHAMAFDSIRRRVVIFGGLPVSPADREGAQDQLLGDTWEHSDEEGASPAPPPPPGPAPGQLASFSIAPDTIRRGERATGTVTLNANVGPDDPVILNVTPNVLLMDPPVVNRGNDFGLPVFGVSAQFRFRDIAGTPLPPLPLPITIKATLGDSFLTATVTMIA